MMHALLLAVALGAQPQPEITFYGPTTVRVVRAPKGLPAKAVPIVVARPGKVAVAVAEDGAAKTWKSSALTVRLDKRTSALAFLKPDGTTLLAEAKPADFAERTYSGDYRATSVAQRWAYAKDRPLYGLGSVQNGALDQRHAKKVHIQPENCDDGIPFVCALEGWGLYWDNVSVCDYSSDDATFGFESNVGEAEDYYFMFPGSLDGVVGAMRELTGKVPMNALWSYGFWQSRERYASCDQLLEVLRRYRRDGIPLDGIVQDWQYWGDNDHWNALAFLNPKFADARAMIDEVHLAKCHFIISVWQSFGPKTAPYAELAEKGMLLDLPTYPAVSKPIDVYNPAARAIYWKYAKNLFDYGLDGWWMDSTEPEPWGQSWKSNDIPCHFGRYRDVRLAYPFFAINGVYENTRAAAPDRRVFILTRSAAAGVQRTGANVWSGDTDSTWEFLKKQIPCGLNFSLTGNPNWSCDLGGFKGGVRREDFPELYVRWMQYGVFQPMMRSHGTSRWRELHLFGKPGEPVYDALLASVKLRYRFLPRLYALAHAASASDGSFMRPVAADFPADARTWDQKGAFLFGRDILVAPVTSSNVTSVATYLPQGADWYDYFTGSRVKGGAEVTRPVTLADFPLYVRAGAILVDGPDVQYVGEKPWDDLKVTVYPGADGTFTLYEDAGDGYGYAKGESTTIRFAWDDRAKTLEIGAVKGAYGGMLKTRRFRVAVPGGRERTVSYAGRPVTVEFSK